MYINSGLKSDPLYNLSLHEDSGGVYEYVFIQMCISVIKKSYFIKV